MFVVARYDPMAVPLTVDITTGDAITPNAVEYDYPLMFDDRVIPVMAYPTETVLAEKLETVISRGIANTRPRDYYDIYKLWMVRGKSIEVPLLAQALEATAAKRGSSKALLRYRGVMDEVLTDGEMTGRWESYARGYSYAQGVTLEQCCEAVLLIMGMIEGN